MRFFGKMALLANFLATACTVGSDDSKTVPANIEREIPCATFEDCSKEANRDGDEVSNEANQTFDGSKTEGLAAKLTATGCVDPDLAKVSATQNFMNCSGQMVAGQLQNCDVGSVVSCLTLDSQTAVESGLQSAANIRAGITIGGVLGRYPSEDHPLDVAAISYTSEYCTAERVSNAPFANSGEPNAGETVETPFTICSLSQLDSMRNFLNKHFALKVNIDASATKSMDSGAGWAPIGTVNNGFVGSFDGQGHIIANFNINRPTTNGVGLFAYACTQVSTWTDCANENAHALFLKNLRFENARIVGRSDVGALAGIAYYTAISGVYVKGTISGWNGVGGVTGQGNESTFSNVGANISISAIGNPVGGLSGSAHNADFVECFATGRVSTGKDSSWNSSSVGGIAGWLGQGSITRSFFVGSVNGTGYGVGGLVGGTTTGGSGAISDSYANVDVLGTIWTGGLVGSSQDQTITRSYATGTVSAYHNSANVGGFIGYTNGTVNVTNSFYFGIVRVETSSADQSGAFVGRALTSGGSNSYFTTYVNHSSGAPLTQAHATAKTAAYFEAPLSSENQGSGETFSTWNFDSVWTKTNGSLPTLRCPPNVASSIGCAEWNLAAKSSSFDILGP